MRASSQSSWRKPPGRRSGSRSTGMRNCRSRAIAREPKSRSRFCPAATAPSRRSRSPHYSDAGVAVNSTVAGLARLIYRGAEAKELIDYDVVSNLPPGCAFRAPGGPPMAFALEQAIDEAALRLGHDAIEVRKRWDPNPDRQRLYDWAGGLDTWRRRAAPSPRPAATAAASASPWAIGSISGSFGRRSNLRSRAAVSSPPPPCRTLAPERARSSPTRSRASSASIRMRSRSASAIRSYPKDRRRAAAGSPRRSSRRSSSPPASSRPPSPRRPDASRRPDRTPHGGNSSRRRPISKSRRSGRRTIPRPLMATIRWSRTPG